MLLSILNTNHSVILLVLNKKLRLPTKLWSGFQTNRFLDRVEGLKGFADFRMQIELERTRDMSMSREMGYNRQPSPQLDRWADYHHLHIIYNIYTLSIYLHIIYEISTHCLYCHQCHNLDWRLSLILPPGPRLLTLFAILTLFTDETLAWIINNIDGGPRGPRHWPHVYGWIIILP